MGNWYKVGDSYKCKVGKTKECSEKERLAILIKELKTFIGSTVYTIQDRYYKGERPRVTINKVRTVSISERKVVLYLTSGRQINMAEFYLSKKEAVIECVKRIKKLREIEDKQIQKMLETR